MSFVCSRSMLSKIFSVSMLALFCAMQGIACCQSVKGRVVDSQSNEPLSGVSVFWSGTSIGTTTSSPDGAFSLPLHNKENHLVARIMGYENDTVVVRHDTVVTFSLAPSSKRLGRVIVKRRRKNQFTNMSSLELTEVITSEGLRGLACCNLGESFENSATVDVGYSDAVSGSKQIQLLGLTGVYSQMLLENTPFLRGIAAPFGLGYVPGQWMESISVSKGVATVKNGYEAITGTINLEYQKPKKDDRFSLNLYENSELRSELTARLSHRFSDRLATGLLLYGTYGAMRSDHIGHDGYMDSPLQNQLNIANRWHYEGKNGLVSQTLFNYIHENRLGGDMRFEREMRGSDTIYGFGGVTDRLHFFSKNGFAISNTASFGSQISGTWERRDAFYGQTDYSGDQRDLYVNLLVNAEVSGGHVVDFGVSASYNDVSEMLEKAIVFHYPLIISAEGLPQFFFNTTSFVPGAFGQYTFRYGDDFNATLGLRYDYNSFYQRHLVTPRLHFRWQVVKGWVLRGSAGRGFRSPTVVAENMGLLASSRVWIFDDAPGVNAERWDYREHVPLEEAWNGGLNLAKKVKLDDDREMTFTVDFYHTEFVSQLLVDLDADESEVRLTPLSGRSFSNVVQADFSIEPLTGFTVSLAGKVNDVRYMSPSLGTMVRKPYTSLWKALMVLSYHTRYDKWRFDFTTQFNGPQRIPVNYGTAQGMVPDEAPAYIYMLGQVSRRFKRFELYGGVENITGYVQPHPVIGYDNPFSTGFDASVVYAPLMGRLFYLGLRYNIM